MSDKGEDMIVGFIDCLRIWQCGCLVFGCPAAALDRTVQMAEGLNAREGGSLAELKLNLVLFRYDSPSFECFLIIISSFIRAFRKGDLLALNLFPGNQRQ